MRKVYPYFIVLSCFLGACQKEVDTNAGEKNDEVKALNLALDSAYVLYQNPLAPAIAKRVYEKVKSAPNHPLYHRTLRLVSMVLLSKSFPVRAYLDSAVSFAQRSGETALLKNDSIEWALSEIQVGRYHYLRSYWLAEYEETMRASVTFLQAIDVLEKKDVKEELAFAYYWLAGSTTQGKDFLTKELTYKLRALTYNDSSKFPGLRAKICNSLAVTYNDYTNDLNRGKPFLLRAKAILEKLDDKFTLSIVLGNLGDVYERQGNIKQSLYYFHAAAIVAHTAELWQREADAYHQVAKLYQSAKRYDSAVFYNAKTLAIIKKQSKYPVDVVNGWKAEMAESYIKTGHRDIARDLVNSLESALARKTIEGGELADVSETLSHLIDVYQALGDYRGLSVAQGKLLNLRDTLYSKEQLVELGRIESLYEMQLKDKELKVLQLSIQLQDENAKVARYILLLLATGVLITTVGLIVVLRLLKQKNRLYKSLGQRNVIIEQQKIELEQSLKDLQRAQSHMLTSEKMVMLGQFTAGVAHELNNPLNFISGGVSVLDDVVERLVAYESTKEEIATTSEEFYTVLKNINNGVDRMTAIVESLQIFSNPREAAPDKSESDVAECLDASLLLIKSKLQSDRIHVETSYSSVKVLGHSGRISQVFINLIDNAIHALLSNPAKERRLTVSMSITDNEVYVNFEDNGIGIPEDIKSYVFNAFFTTKETGQGTGLGLFVCYNIVKELGGKITFKSEVGQGTTFTVSLLRAKF